jgi:hypothetical protein
MRQSREDHEAVLPQISAHRSGTAHFQGSVISK